MENFRRWKKNKRSIYSFTWLPKNNEWKQKEDIYLQSQKIQKNKQSKRNYTKKIPHIHSCPLMDIEAEKFLKGVRGSAEDVRQQDGRKGCGFAVDAGCFQHRLLDIYGGGLSPEVDVLRSEHVWDIFIDMKR